MTSPIARHRIRPHDDELLSSYLMRVAHAEGTSPQRWAQHHLRHLELWTRDADRALPTSTMSTLAAHLGCSMDSITALSVDTGLDDRQPRCHAGVEPWITAVGLFHRIRHLHGLQYCPACLAEEPYFRRLWRLAFVTHCPVHHRVLLDGCVRCDAPIVPHRHERLPTHCPICGMDLAHPTISGEPTDDTTMAYVSQSSWLNAQSTRRFALGTASIPWHDALKGCRALIAVHRCSLTQTLRMLPPRSGVFEAQRVGLRMATMQWLHRVLAHWPRAWLEDARRGHVTQRSFHRQASIPPWLQHALQFLHVGHTRDRWRRARAFQVHIRRLRQLRPPHWRTDHAQQFARWAP
ncbi:MAG: TniQ family protein [Planctomycetes bacterium]|nr:TniQ family protein [Planctomycetota bacterium]